MTQRYAGNSLVNAAIKELSRSRDFPNGHPIDKSMYVRLKPPTDGGCPWRTSEEDHWVADLATRLLDRSRLYRPELQFHQFFEKPSHQSESKRQGGYDLSAGPFDLDTLRIRSMHKVVKGKWCDAYWTWRADQRDKDHMHALVNNPEGYPCYLVVNVFYCLHDWRRMGCRLDVPGHHLDGFVVPDFNSPLRTIIVDLMASRTHLPKGANVVIGCEGLREPVGSSQEWSDRTAENGFAFAVADGQPLTTVSVDKLLKDVDSYWKDRRIWRSSDSQTTWNPSN